MIFDDEKWKDVEKFFKFGVPIILIMIFLAAFGLGAIIF